MWLPRAHIPLIGNGLAPRRAQAQHAGDRHGLGPVVEPPVPTTARSSITNASVPFLTNRGEEDGTTWPPRPASTCVAGDGFGTRTCAAHSGRGAICVGGGSRRPGRAGVGAGYSSRRHLRLGGRRGPEPT